jgi:hypothetical protein
MGGQTLLPKARFGHSSVLPGCIPGTMLDKNYGINVFTAAKIT